MKHKNFLVLSICLLILMVACTCGLLPEKNKPAIEVNEDGSVEVNATGAAQSEFALQTQIANIEATKQTLGDSVSETAQALCPTVDQSDPNAQQATATPVDPGAYQTLPAPGATTLSVSVDTNCRQGPGIGYQAIDSVLMGQSVEVLGVDASGAYYIVRSPNGSICWVWSNYATVQGEVNSLALMTPPAPPQNIAISNWQDQLVIQPSKDFSWQGHWIVGAPGSQTYADWYNAQVGNCDDCFRLASVEMDISRQGSYLDIELIEELYWLDGDTATHATYGIGQVSDDNTIAVGTFYLTEWLDSNGLSGSWAWDTPFMWYQNGNSHQFIGDWFQWAACAARDGTAFPVPCSWP